MMITRFYVGRLAWIMSGVLALGLAGRACAAFAPDQGAAGWRAGASAPSASVGFWRTGAAAAADPSAGSCSGPCSDDKPNMPAAGGPSTAGSAAGRNYIIGVYADPADTLTPALMGYPWDFTINNSYQDNCPGCGVWGLTTLGGYPVIIDLNHVQSSYADFAAAANGGYFGYYQKTAQALKRYASQIYAVRIDSEFNGSWSAASAFAHPIPVSASVWIAGFRNLAMAVHQALPNAKIIWNPAIGQHDPFPYYPGDDIVDLIGPDVYCNPAYVASSAACWNDSLSGAGGANLQAFAAFGKKHGKSIVIPEWADLFGDGYMVRQMRDWMDSNDVVAQSYWDSGDDLHSTAALPALTTNQKAYVAAFGNRPYTGTYWKPYLPVPNSASRK